MGQLNNRMTRPVNNPFARANGLLTGPLEHLLDHLHLIPVAVHQWQRQHAAHLERSPHRLCFQGMEHGVQLIAGQIAVPAFLLQQRAAQQQQAAQEKTDHGPVNRLLRDIKNEVHDEHLEIVGSMINTLADLIEHIPGNCRDSLNKKIPYRTNMTTTTRTTPPARARRA
jgi:hypothetical protein